MAFVLQYGGDGPLARQRWHLEWLRPMLNRRAKELGWNEREPLCFVDSDSHSLGGIVPGTVR